MQLTRGTDYGIMGMVYLAMQPFDKVTLLHEIAESQEMPESYLAKVFQDLSREGLVCSRRGAKGGFCLARPASEITLLQVIEALQGPVSLNRCLDIREGCPHLDTCPVAPVLREAQAQLLETLDAATFDMLANESLALRAKQEEQTA